MSEANVWKTLAAQMDNFSSQIGRFTRNQIANDKAKAAAQSQLAEPKFIY